MTHNLLLEQLSEQLFQEISHSLTHFQADFLKSKWNIVRDIAAQNGGYGHFGKHLLNLSFSEKKQLTALFQETICSIEESGLETTHLIREKKNRLLGIEFLINTSIKLKLSLFNKEFAKALFVKYNSQLVAEHRKTFQEIFDCLVSDCNLSQRNPVVTEILVGNLISLLPYFDFEEGSSIFLYQKIEEKWEKIAYGVEHICLVKDKIVAYGLCPLTNSKASSLLIFRGTPYPTAAGFFDALISDFHPANSIGKDIFEKGRNSLDQWMKDKAQVKCFGVSLGGSLAYRMGLVYGEKVKIYAYGAPGMITHEKKAKKVHGRICFHYQDIIRFIGFYPQSTHLDLYVLITKEKKDPFITHTQLLGIDPVIVLKIHPRYENLTDRRYLVNICKAVMSFPLFLILFPVRVVYQLKEKIRQLFI